jgi:hypothetical protein
MLRKLLAAVLLLIALLVLLLWRPARGAESEERTQVTVTNFPEVQHIDGTVSVRGPIPGTALVHLANITVSPAQRTEVDDFSRGGTLETAGYARAVLSLTGHIKGSVVRSAEVGAILIPDETPVLDAFNEEQQLQFPLTVAASNLAVGKGFFASEPTAVQVAFPRYKVFFFNTSDKTVEVDLFAYLLSD